ncbi:polysaccharide deacetylase family protein [Kitasatospora kifunensis]|uniref:Peptidoglycan/xylan/chitin deacetylase (PgdA/CDA1 family) n=1 Tax=Kitasatospora kifunensis TaxID=58351 RepID=A0A7W7W0A5_KITKI|nr:polysaccharide deacetylase family protein [Kitasatospora kifunensis]MBB4928963.1 peptidoglycan/xylan/chitin deacetylase (PgdA/CDA1 family) [Kitasatospora kifunensis]
MSYFSRAGRPTVPAPATRLSAQTLPTLMCLCAAVLGPAGQSAKPSPPAPDCARLACVALTFDDGPSVATDSLLDDLAADHTKATFFLVGQEARYRTKQVKREQAEGHAIGNHTLTHPYLGDLTPAQVHDELAGGEQAIADITGTRPWLVRPPYGNQSAQVASFGHPLLLWDLDTLDWWHHDPAQVLSRAAAGVRSGSIVLMHDTENQRDTLTAVPQLIRNLRNAGYTLVTVPELFGAAALKPGTAYRNRSSATRPEPQPQPWADPLPTTAQDTAQDTDAAIAGTVLLRYHSAAATGPAQLAQAVGGLRPGECRNVVQPLAALAGAPAFALRDDTAHGIELYDQRDCSHQVAANTMAPGTEQDDEVRSFKVH